MLRLVHLYADLMNLYGDRGNIIALQRRCDWRGIALEVQDLTLGENLEPSTVDILFFGGGQDVEQETVSRDLARGVGRAIQEAVEDGAALLSVCGGYQLLGRFFRTTEGVEIPGVGLFDAHTVAGDRRMVGDVIVEADLGQKPSTLVGFENHSGQTFLGPGAHPLGRVQIGHGNNGVDRTEGVRYRNAVGTYLHGPLLPKNPALADWIIESALGRRDGLETPLAALDDRVELEANTAQARRIRQAGPRRASIR
ncbi:MAG: glutamine amidotransferase [Chloroflexi bacterium]|nr:glutamine amidotransferase [Chloroflexota bacterium]